MQTHKWLLLVICCFLLFVFWQILDAPNNTTNQVEEENFPLLDSPASTHLGNLQYAVVFDLGSSGSRANIFTWQRNKFSHCSVANGGGFHDLKPMQEGTKKIKPGVSQLSSTPSQIGDSLAPLWSFLHEKIPTSEHKNTPVFMFATAGLRVLGEAENEKIYDDDDQDDNVILEVDDDDYSKGPVAKILNHLRSYVSHETSFRLIQNDHIRVLRGEEEGLFDYLTVQQLIRLNPSAKLGGSEDTWSQQVISPAITVPIDLYPICTVDLGGASTQIALESTTSQYTHNITEFTKTPFKANYPKIFTHSFLDYGINRARELYQLSVISSNHDNNMGKIVQDPCSFEGHSYKVLLNQKEYQIDGTGNYVQCKTTIRGMFDKYIGPRDCSVTPCAMHDVHFSLFPANELKVIAFDHAYRVGALLSCKGYSTIDEAFDRTKQILGQNWETVRALPLFSDLSTEELEKFPFEATYVASLLHYGYQFSKAQQIGFADTVDQQSLSWALGALVHNVYQLCERSII